MRLRSACLRIAALFLLLMALFPLPAAAEPAGSAAPGRTPQQSLQKPPRPGFSQLDFDSKAASLNTGKSSSGPAKTANGYDEEPILKDRLERSGIRGTESAKPEEKPQSAEELRILNTEDLLRQTGKTGASPAPRR